MQADQIARCAHESLRLFQFLLGGPDEAIPELDNLDQHELEDLSQKTKDTLASPSLFPHQLHELWRLKMTELGWKWGFFFDEGRKEDPLLCEWEETPVGYQSSRTFFHAMVVLLGIESGVISGAVLKNYLEATSEEKAMQESQAVAKEITNEA